MPLKITIGIATWNRCDLLRQTLEAMTNLRIPADVTWEILVCDNNSTDGTKEVVESMSSRLPITYLFEVKQGLAHAHANIDKNASGDWLFITDDDVLVEPDWIEAYVVAIRRYPDVGFLFGQILPWLTKPISKRAQFLLDEFPWVNALKYIEKDCPSDGSPGKLPHGANMAFRRDALKEVGFDASRGLFGDKRVGGEDTMLGLGMLSKGYRGWLVKDAKVKHYIHHHRLNLRWFWTWNEAAGEARCEEEGPAPRGRFGHAWGWRLIGKRLFLACRHWFFDRKKAYELIGDAARWRGYLKASADATKKPASPIA